MIELEEAQRRILELATPLETETVPLWDADQRVTAEPVKALVDLPVFDNSAMDGYAIQVADQDRLGGEGQAGIEVAGEIPAGSAPDVKVESGTCVRIFTGSILPEGADAVIMQEDVEVWEDGGKRRIRILDRVKPWENVRFQGEEIRQGQIICEAGQELGPAYLALLSHAGVSEIKVKRRLKVGILATGEELVEPGTALQRGQIYESNRVAYAALIRRAGAEATVYSIVPDDLVSTCRAMEQAFSECDWVLTSGGVSVGEHDYVRDAFEKLGGESIFWKIRMKPGKPFAMGRLSHGKLWFGAPGNPVSGLVSFHLLVAPAIRQAHGITNPLPIWRAGVLTDAVNNPGNRRHFVRGRLMDSGGLQPLTGQASHRLSSIADANLLLDIPAGSSMSAGSEVRYCFLGG